MWSKYSDITVLWDVAGSTFRRRPIFDSSVCEFIGALSKRLLDRSRSLSLPDVASFAFWCRHKNLMHLKSNYPEKELRFGLGEIFHVTANNVPTNFAYSLVMGLLAGNRNLVKLPSVSSDQAELIVTTIGDLLSSSQFADLGGAMTLLRYRGDNPVNGALSSSADARMLWGGDAAVNAMKLYPTQPHTLDLTFPERFSYALLKSEEVAKLDDEGMTQFCSRFHNDALTFDQNACSSPRVIFWVGEDPDNSIERFWTELSRLHDERSGYGLSESSNRLSHLSHFLARSSGGYQIREINAPLLRISSEDFHSDFLESNLRFGAFLECHLDGVASLQDYVRPKVQTVTYFGFEREELIQIISEQSSSGVDRFVPVGRALEMGLVWDGKDIIRSLSKSVVIET